MKAISYTVLFAILSPGLLLLVPSVFKAILKNPLSFLAIVLNIALFYLALMNIKYIPYLNTLEGFQDTTVSQDTIPSQTEVPLSSKPPQNSAPTDSNGNRLVSIECEKCVKKSHLFISISTCESDCGISMESASCDKCISNNIGSMLKSHCSSVCPEQIISANSSNGNQAASLPK